MPIIPKIYQRRLTRVKTQSHECTLCGHIIECPRCDCIYIGSIKCNDCVQQEDTEEDSEDELEETSNHTLHG